MTTPCAVWFRVSTGHQDSDNQVPDVERFTAHHGYTIAARYELDDSAWKDGQGGPVYQATLKQALQDAWAGKFKVIVVWSLDRISRNGAEDVLRLVRQFRERGVTLLSVQEPWLNSSPEIQDVLLAFAGWMAQQESNRKSERIRAGLARRKAQGLPVGRQPGAVDKAKRKRSGYVARYERAAKVAS
jgi:putative DNA-invertase from lambdoid prophage Rac